MPNGSVSGFGDEGREIHRTFTAYSEAFARDPAAAASFCCEPMLLALPNEIKALSIYAEIEAYYRTALNRLKALGYSHSVLGSHQVKMLNPTTALYEVPFTRMRSDGAVLEKSAATYLYRKETAGWKICAGIATDLDKLL